MNLEYLLTNYTTVIFVECYTIKHLFEIKLHLNVECIVPFMKFITNKDPSVFPDTKLEESQRSCAWWQTQFKFFN